MLVEMWGGGGGCADPHVLGQGIDFLCIKIGNRYPNVLR